MVDLKQRMAVQVEITGEGAEPQSIAEREASRFTVFPNPVSEIIHLEINGSWNYEVSDAEGKTVANGIIGKNTSKIQVQSLPTGIYHIVIWNKDERRYARFIKK